MFEILVILLLILLNGFFAMSEMAIVSARRARLEQMARSGSRRARMAAALTTDPSHFLSTVQVGITLIGILAGAYGGATVAAALSRWLSGFPALAPYAEALGFGLVVVAITYLSLIIGELVPKRLALSRPEAIAITVSGPMRVFSLAMGPMVKLLTLSTELVLKLLPFRAARQPEVTEDEIKIMLAEGARAGLFEDVEREMIERVFRLGDQRVGALMTPRPQVVWLDLTDDEATLWNKIEESGHSRFPVCDGGLDAVTGVVQIRDLLLVARGGRGLDLRAAMRPPLFVPVNLPAFTMLNLFKERDVAMAFVMDEYGVLEGVVTTADLLEAVVGIHADAETPASERAVQREDGSWLLDGMMPADEFRDLLEVGALPGEKKGRFHTLAGFVVAQLGRLPTVGERFELGGLRFEVVDMDGRRIDRVLVSRIEEPSIGLDGVD